MVFACEPRTELETLYCQLNHQYRQLPNLEEFRRNSPRIQRLLLKRPARESGLELPPEISRDTSAVPLGNNTKAAKKVEPLSREAIAKVSLAQHGDNQLCRLSRRKLVCGSDVYQLMDNQLNHQLPTGSLEADNRLNFSDSGSRTTAHYWSDSYRRYIEKMLSIGLGASTMSYTKFVYTWQESQRQGQTPEVRFAAMFEYLKRDKRSLAVRARYDNLVPEAISWCQPLTHELWVCDNGERNWVYQRSQT